MISSPNIYRKSIVAWAILRTLLGLETLGAVALLIFTLVSAFADKGDFTQIISIVLMSVAVVLWVGITFTAATRGRTSRARASAVTIHVLMFAAGTGCLQIGIGPWWLGFAIVVLAIAGFAAAMFARPDQTVLNSIDE